MPVTLSREGQRIYFVGDTYPIKDKIKSQGGHWDGDRKAWWIGTTMATKAEEIVAAPAQAEEVDVDKIKIIGKAEYNGRSYYVRWQGTCKNGAEKFHLCTIDGKIDFWADASQCRWVKRYEERSYKGRSQPMTLGSLRRFMNKAKRAEGESQYKDASWMSNGCSACRALGDWCERCAFDEFDN